MGKTLLSLMALGSLALGSAGCALTPEGHAFFGGVARGMVQSGANSYASERARVAANPANSVPPQTNVYVQNPPQQPQVQPAVRYYDGPINDGKYYKGMLLNGIPHGRGVLSGKDGEGNEIRCEGEFRNGLPNGMCVYTGTENGFQFKYEGEVKDGIPNGKGIIIKKNTRGESFKHDGEFVQGQFITPVILAYNKIVDLNDDKQTSLDEIFGLGKRTFNLDKERMTIEFSIPNYKGEKVTFRSWTLDGKLLGTDERTEIRNKAVRYYTGPDSPTKGDFIDNIKGAGPGRYKITANIEGVNKTYSIDVTIIKDKE